MTYTGRCNCGAITVTISAQPVTTRQCWCRQCQKIAGGGPTNNAIFPAEAVILSGETRRRSYVAASGNVLVHEFCSACGSPVMAQSSARPHLRTVRFGILDEGHGLAPVAAIWLDEAPAWARIDPAMEQWPGQPAAPSPPGSDTP